MLLLAYAFCNPKVVAAQSAAKSSDINVNYNESELRIKVCLDRVVEIIILINILSYNIKMRNVFMRYMDL